MGNIRRSRRTTHRVVTVLIFNHSAAAIKPHIYSLLLNEAVELKRAGNTHKHTQTNR